ncbi:hypothetical protein [Duganella aceris]|uniref:Uncharacterized protein n=1 Tax=Duganella aceris TaxID=2703883 RepID=A0ABX0FP62_9BURK|nr:hypothetical protein [Duganella aceris]NGZ86427.1 hypothetical protein [Duganella aceris]
MQKEIYENKRRYHEASGGLNYGLEVFGDVIAEREGYRSVKGIDAVHFYLIHKFSWLPRDVIGMSFEHLRFVLSEELEGWTLPPAAR